MLSAWTAYPMTRAMERARRPEISRMENILGEYLSFSRPLEDIKPEPIDLGATVGVVSMARRVLPSVEATVIARHAGPVRLAGGLTVLANHGIETAPPCDVVIVCGGSGWPEAACPMCDPPRSSTRAPCA